jgi:hypothetical protein
MSFVYGLVADNQVPLAEFDAGGGGNYRKVARDLLRRCKFDGARSAYDQDKFIFSCISEPSHIAVIILSDRGINANTRFYAVEQIRQRFSVMYGSAMGTAGECSKSGEFGPEIQRIFRECQAPSTAKIAQINANLASAQHVMAENLSRALERSEKLEVMEVKSEEIRNSASAFQRDSTSLKNAMCIQRFKWYALGAVIVLVIVLVLVLVIVMLT